MMRCGMCPARDRLVNGRGYSRMDDGCESPGARLHISWIVMCAREVRSSARRWCLSVVSIAFPQESLPRVFQSRSEELPSTRLWRTVWNRSWHDSRIQQQQNALLASLCNSKRMRYRAASKVSSSICDRVANDYCVSAESASVK